MTPWSSPVTKLGTPGRRATAPAGAGCVARRVRCGKGQAAWPGGRGTGCLELAAGCRHQARRGDNLQAEAGQSLLVVARTRCSRLRWSRRS